MLTAAIGLERSGKGGRSLWPELLAGLEWTALKISPVYYGIGVPRGDGDPVVLIPGFLGSDATLLEMHLWLRRIGYRSYLSGIGRNADCPDILIERLLETIARAYRETGRKVRLVGHSLGGLLARTAAVRQPHQVAQVITLASPFRRLSAHPLVLALIKRVRGRALVRHFGNRRGSCEWSFLAALEEPMPGSVARTAIYSRSDPVVDWRDCVEIDEAQNVEVTGTHIGLPFNPLVYRELARLLRSVQPAARARPIVPQSDHDLPRAA